MPIGFLIYGLFGSVFIQDQKFVALQRAMTNVVKEV